VLYEMVTGTKPFFRAGNGDVNRRPVEAELAPPIAGFGIDDPELSSVLVRGLRSSSADRFSDIHSLGVVLARWLLRQGVEEDVTTESLRAVWLEAGSSLPPTALDVGEGAQRSIAAALAERVDIPKKSAFRLVLGIAAGVLTLVMIGVAGVYTVGGSPRPVTSPAPAPTRVLTSPLPKAPAPAEAERLDRSETALAVTPVPAAPLVAQPKAAVPKATHGGRSESQPRAPKRSMRSPPAFPTYELSPDVRLPSGDDGYVAPNAGAPPPAANNPYNTDQPARPLAPSENPYGAEAQ
jgi:hypothetical protein